MCSDGQKDSLHELVKSYILIYTQCRSTLKLHCSKGIIRNVCPLEKKGTKLLNKGFVDIFMDNQNITFNINWDF